jgi:hypothetical protein
MSVTILEAARSIQKPTTKSCLNPHAFAGGGNNFKRGDLEWEHLTATRSMDVHMASRSKGGAGLSCLGCHITNQHRIAGRGSDLRPIDLPVSMSCTDCHKTYPHSDEKLDRHTKRVCHIPTFAKVSPTDVHRRWNLPGELVEHTGLFEPNIVKKRNVKPKYRFFNGTSVFYHFGEPTSQQGGWMTMSAPVGNVRDPQSKIHAFKRHRSIQPMDPKTGVLLPLKIGYFFQTGELDQAVKLGTEAVGWDYSGHVFAKTQRFMGLFHEVAPAEDALSCNDCHGVNRLNFKQLGYQPKTTLQSSLPFHRLIKC